jgi:hypothetical protein
MLATWQDNMGLYLVCGGESAPCLAGFGSDDHDLLVAIPCQCREHREKKKENCCQ